jgi:hypothetical protein
MPTISQLIRKGRTARLAKNKAEAEEFRKLVNDKGRGL